VKRREFLESSLAAVVLAGCGGGTPEVGPETLRVSRTDVYAEDLNGVLYRATPSANVVSRIGAGGAPVWTIGSHGSGPLQFDFPAAIAADNRGRVLVVDRGNARVQILDGDSGRYLGAFGSVGTGPGQFRLARHIATAGDRIYVVDQLNHRVNVFDINGQPILAIGSSGTGAAGLNMPRGVAVDRNGAVYVSDSTSPAIKRFAANGTFEARVDGGNVAHPHALAFDRDGNLWVADGAAGRVVVLGNGAVKQRLATKLPDGRAAAPHDIALSGRDIYVRAVPNGA
jgi:DNA-binding beta-propeller fold protein YncE